MSTSQFRFIKRVEKIPWQIIDSCALILTPESSMAHELNEVATWIWQNIERETSIKDLTENLIEIFEIDVATAEKDIREFAESMAAKGMVECQ